MSIEIKMFQRNIDTKLTEQYYSKVRSEDYKRKEAVLASIRTNDLSLRMTRYVYGPSFKYQSIFRIRNHFNLNTIGYFD